MARLKLISSRVSEYELIPFLFLLVANTLPVIGVIKLNWNLFSLILVYWLEAGVVGFFNVFKVAHAKGNLIAKLILTPFFFAQYFLFLAIYGIVVFLVFNNGYVDVAGILAVYLAFFLMHGSSYYFLFLQKREYTKTTPSTQITYPYRRIGLIHLFIIVYAFIIRESNSQVALLSLVILKTILDAREHIVTHIKSGAMEFTK